jgi:hypothetical protein
MGMTEQHQFPCHIAHARRGGTVRPNVTESAGLSGLDAVPRRVFATMLTLV